MLSSAAVRLLVTVLAGAAGSLASAADLRGFYGAALAAYKWNAAGNCWEYASPSRRLCLEAGNNSAVITITDK